MSFREGGTAWRRSAPDLKFLPGLALAAALAAVSTVMAEWIGVGLLGYATSPVSAVLVAVFLGLLLANTVGVPAGVEPGLTLCVKRLLRIGIALLGIRLSLVAVASIGLVALPVVVVTIVSALLLVTALARLIGLPPRLGTLIAAGTSICGITAIVAIAPVIDADDNETSYAVATIALFGMAALFAYPFLAHFLFTDATQVGLFLGTAIHDTSQVVGAALAYQEQFQAPATLDTAVVAKLVRNLSMVAVIPLLGLLHARGPGSSRATRPRGLVPLFLVGFVSMALLRTFGDLGDAAFGIIPTELWERGIGVVQEVAEIALLLGMAAVGLGTALRNLYALGLRPLSVGLAAALAVGGRERHADPPPVRGLPPVTRGGMAREERAGPLIPRGHSCRRSSAPNSSRDATAPSDPRRKVTGVPRRHSLSQRTRKVS